MTTYIPRVEQWVQQAKERLATAQPGTMYHAECQKILEQDEALLADLQKIHEPKQASLLPREPGAEG
ncbi:MAG: hypothetical protein WBA09_22485 [Candidatus Acidiferrum sp.]